MNFNRHPLFISLFGLLLCTSLFSAMIQAENNPVDEPTLVENNDEMFDDEFDDDFADDFDDDFDDAPPPLVIHDPLEPLNRGMFWFNDKLYFYALKPVAKTYRYIPEPIRISLSNFLSNLTTPIRFVNALMQGKVNDAGNEMGRFFINTIVGVGGLFDPARKYAGLRKKEEDFGQTLAVLGIKPGPYLVIPFIGPSNTRDGVGYVVDTLTDPIGIVWQGQDYWAVKVTDTVNQISLDKDTYEAITGDALDPYLFVRDAYMQNRAGKVNK